MKYISVIFSLVLVAYLAVALTMTSRTPSDTMCRGIRITVDDPSPHPFVTVAELERELDSLPSRARSMKIDDINPAVLRDRLLSIDKIEDVEVVTLTDGTIDIRVTPIMPVARVFDGDNSYYINRRGKRVTANARYHKDVPVIAGRFNPADTVFTPLSVLPVIDYIAADSLWSRFFTMVEVKSPSDILLVPVVREHVVDIGDCSDLDSKFSRLRRFYTEVLHHKGWETYDTVSLKWRGQVVATRRKKLAPVHLVITDEEDEAVDTLTMLAGDNVAPGQTVPGRKAHDETPIPKKQTPVH